MKPVFSMRMRGTHCLVLLAAAVAGLAGCGYHQVGAATHVPGNVRTLAVPVVQSKVQGFRTEAVFTEAVVRELNTRTQYRVLTSGDGSSADATLRGTIVTQTIAPLTYDSSSGQTSSYLVTVTAQVALTAHDGTVLYRNDAFGWREQFQSTQDLSGSVQEDSAAVRRMGHDFAEALVSDMLESFR
jgi:outer membrane lipopolysaccharide assembly protein LptE/RlpB